MKSLIAFGALALSALSASAFYPNGVSDRGCQRQALTLAATKMDRPRLVSFRSTTPGSYDQEYVGVFRNQSGQRVTLRFYSEVACESPMNGELELL